MDVIECYWCAVVKPKGEFQEGRKWATLPLCDDCGSKPNDRGLPYGLQPWIKLDLNDPNLTGSQLARKYQGRALSLRSAQRSVAKFKVLLIASVSVIVIALINWSNDLGSEYAPRLADWPLAALIGGLIGLVAAVWNLRDNLQYRRECEERLDEVISQIAKRTTVTELLGEVR